MLCDAVLCGGMLCHGVLCCALLRNVVLCRVSSRAPSGILGDSRDNWGSGGRGMQGGGGREVFPLNSNDPSLSGEE